jgi:uncharacterized PurR-regulated membrane protein YhhQ (DUF165 family)
MNDACPLAAASDIFFACGSTLMLRVSHWKWKIKLLDPFSNLLFGRFVFTLLFTHTDVTAHKYGHAHARLFSIARRTTYFASIILGHYMYVFLRLQ